MQALGQYPPLMGGGLIEALYLEGTGITSLPYPPLMGGGLIEAVTIFAPLSVLLDVSAAHGRRPH